MRSDSYRPTITPAFVARATGAPLPGLSRSNSAPAEGSDLYRPFTAVVTDSRKAVPGCLFVALKGENFDGHDFIDMVLGSKARGIVCRKDYPIQLSSEAKFFPVDDTLVAYRKIAASWRREFSIPLVAVAGSAGKTTTKELLAAIFRGRWPQVLKTQGSQNGFVGIPLTLLELRPEHGAAVIEVGIDEIGAMEKHMQLLNANAAILTAIGPEHLEKLRDLPTVAHEEGIALSHTAQSGGLVVVHLDDPWIRPFAKTLRSGKKLFYSLDGTALPSQVVGATEEEVLRGEISADGSAVQLKGLGLDGVTLALPLLGKHNASNLLGAVALARGLGLSIEEIQAGLATFKGAEGRSELRTLGGITPVICDYYNAQPASVEAGLELLTQIARRDGKARSRWACLGDMLELGPGEEGFHRGLAAKIQALRIEHVLLYGPRMRWLESELRNRGFDGLLAHFSSRGELAQALLEGARPGDAVLIKGSRGMRMEEVWKVLDSSGARLAQPAPDTNPG